MVVWAWYVQSKLIGRNPMVTITYQQMHNQTLCICRQIRNYTVSFILNNIGNNKPYKCHHEINYEHRYAVKALLGHFNDWLVHFILSPFTQRIPVAQSCKHTGATLSILTFANYLICYKHAACFSDSCTSFQSEYTGMSTVWHEYAQLTSTVFNLNESTAMQVMNAIWLFNTLLHA